MKQKVIKMDRAEFMREHKRLLKKIDALTREAKIQRKEIAQIKKK